MDQRISAMVSFDHGTHGYDESYNQNWTVDHYLAHFVAETKRANLTKNAVVEYLKITEHNDDGSLKTDEDGRRIYKFIYTRPQS